MTTILTGNGIEYAALCALKGAVKLEKVGMRHSSGRSMRKRAALAMGLKSGASHDNVIAALEKRIHEMLVVQAQQDSKGATRQ